MPDDATPPGAARGHGYPTSLGRDSTRFRENAPARTSWRCLVIDADATSANAVQSGLRAAGVHVRSAASAATGLRLATEDRPDLIVLDVALPDGDGLDVCRRLRSADVDAHVLIVSHQAQVALKVAGLSSGADDYLTKPFAMAEFMARVQAMLRRRLGRDRWLPGSDDLRAPRGLIVLGDLVVDPARHIAHRKGVEVPLTRTEFRLLEFFLAHPWETLTKERILHSVWGSDFTGNINIVERYVGYLRQKLDRHGPPLIRTVRLVGYALQIDRAQAC